MPTVSHPENKSNNKRARDKTSDSYNCEMYLKKQKKESCGHCDKFEILLTSISKKLC